VPRSVENGIPVSWAEDGGALAVGVGVGVAVDVAVDVGGVEVAGESVTEFISRH
jgi:hypothetical protein